MGLRAFCCQAPLPLLKHISPHRAARCKPLMEMYNIIPVDPFKDYNSKSNKSQTTTDVPPLVESKCFAAMDRLDNQDKTNTKRQKDQKSERVGLAYISART